MRRTLCGISLAVLQASVGLAQARSPLSIEGVWRVVEIRFTRPDTVIVISEPQPGLFIFAKSHYSSTWVPQSAARKSFAKRFEPTREELAEACDALVINSGTYELAGSRLTVRPLVTRMPEFSGGRMIYRAVLEPEGLSLEVIDEYSRDEIRAPWLSRQRLALKLQRVE